MLFRSRLLALTCLLLSAMFSQTAWAAGSDWYQIEVLVFAQTHPDTSEHLNPTLLPHYNNQAIHLASSNPELPADASAAIQQAATQGAWKLQPRNDKDPVAAMAARMAASGNYRTLFYGHWQQPLPANQSTLPIYLQGGRTITTATAPSSPQPMDATNAADPTSGLPELQGTISLTRGNFLHLETNLWFAKSTGTQPVFAHIDEARRLKNGELHYLDNSQFGLLIRVTPIGN